MSKNIRIILLTAAVVLSLSGCREKSTKSADVIIIDRPTEETHVRGPQALDAVSDTKTVEMGDKSYSISISRTPADSASMVTDAYGDRYFDNRIQLTIRRSADSSVVLQRDFTKHTFARYVDNGKFDMSRAILEAVVFDRVDGKRFRFGASVAYPNSDDDYIPFVVTIATDGTMSIDRDMEMDTNGATDSI